MSHSLHITKAYYGSSYPITGYGAGGFSFADIWHNGNLLCLPKGFYDISIIDNKLCANSLGYLLQESKDIELLILGRDQVDNLREISAQIKSIPQLKSLKIELMNTGAAVRTYNILLSEARAVGALLFSV